MNPLPFTALVALVLVLGPAHATHPESGGVCPSWTQYVPGDSQSRTYPAYVAIDELFDGYMMSIWIYAESNGVPGLQRDDDYCYTPGYTTETSDTIIF